MQRVSFLLIASACCLCFTACGLISYNTRGAEQARPVYHTVARGENIYQIGLSYGVSERQVALLNGIRNPSRLQPGMRLLIGYRQGEGTNSKITAGNRLASLGSGEKTGASSGLQRGRVTYEDGKLGWPVPGGRVASRFGRRWGKYHDGIDIAAKSGTPILAAHDGLAVYSGNGLSGYGNLVIVRDKTGFTTIYAHNRRNLVSVGANVRRGQKIAEVGSTGRSTGPHLHFEVRMRETRGRYAAVDPLPFFTKSSSKVVNYRINDRLTPILARTR